MLHKLFACNKILITTPLYETEGPNVPTTPITTMVYRQCLPLGVVQLKGKPQCCNGIVDTFGQGRTAQVHQTPWQNLSKPFNALILQSLGPFIYLLVCFGICCGKNLEEKDGQTQLLCYVSLIRACNKVL